MYAHTNAQIVNTVNAYSANDLQQTPVMAKRAETEPSEFWERLLEAWKPKGLPVTQNGVATELDMSQGSTRRWYTGDGLPETEVLRVIAKKGDVTIDWLLNGTLPKRPTAAYTPLGRLLIAWDQLDDHSRDHVYKAALGQLALRAPPVQAVKTAPRT